MNKKAIIGLGVLAGIGYLIYRHERNKKMAAQVPGSAYTNWTGNPFNEKDAYACKPPIYIPAYSEYYNEYGLKFGKVFKTPGA